MSSAGADTYVDAHRDIAGGTAEFEHHEPISRSSDREAGAIDCDRGSAHYPGVWNRSLADRHIGDRHPRLPHLFHGRPGEIGMAVLRWFLGSVFGCRQGGILNDRRGRDLNCLAGNCEIVAVAGRFRYLSLALVEIEQAVDLFLTNKQFLKAAFMFKGTVRLGLVVVKRLLQVIGALLLLGARIRSPFALLWANFLSQVVSTR
jgi:hypothetical protein